MKITDYAEKYGESIDNLSTDVLLESIYNEEQGVSTYRPLPSSVTIKQSSIEGLGLFATEDISAGVNLGMVRIKAEGDSNHAGEWIRTPLGGFVNHSDTPNCQTVGDWPAGWDVKYYDLYAIEDIKGGEEITLCYTMYTPLSI